MGIFSGWVRRRQWRALLDRCDVLILDTETTGFSKAAEVIEIAILDTTGAVRFEALSMSVGSIPAAASDVHGLTRAALRKAGAPAWPEYHDAVARLFRGAALVRAYNAEYDARLLEQTAARHNLRWPPVTLRCVMEAYAEHRGVPGRKGGYRNHKLQDALAYEGASVAGPAHRARGDTLATLAIMRVIAGRKM